MYVQIGEDFVEIDGAISFDANGRAKVYFRDPNIEARVVGIGEIYVKEGDAFITRIGQAQRDLGYDVERVRVLEADLAQKEAAAKLAETSGAGALEL